MLEQVQRRAARYVCHRHHNTSSVSDMMNTLNWHTLQERRLKTRLQMFYKIVNQEIVIPSLKANQKQEQPMVNPTDKLSVTKIVSNFHFSVKQLKTGTDSHLKLL